jgi:hypothetical protein
MNFGDGRDHTLQWMLRRGAPASLYGDESDVVKALSW